jgi:hypothetical protein
MLCSLIVLSIACVETGYAFLPMRQTFTHRNRQKQMGFLIHTTSDNLSWSRSRLAESAAASDETAPFAETEDIDIGSMRVSEIKKELVRLNVSSKDCFDRESLVERLLEARKQPQSSQQESPSIQQGESESATTATATTPQRRCNSTAAGSTLLLPRRIQSKNKQERIICFIGRITSLPSGTVGGHAGKARLGRLS